MASPVVVALALAVLLAPCLLLHPVTGDEDLVRAACAKNQYPKLCTSILLADASSLKADVLGLAGVAGKVLLANATETFAFVRKLATKDPENIALQSCLGTYKATAGEVGTGVRLLLARSPGRVQSYLVEAYQAGQYCRSSFNGDPYPRGLAARDVRLKRLTFVTIDILAYSFRLG